MVMRALLGMALEAIYIYTRMSMKKDTLEMGQIASCRVVMEGLLTALDSKLNDMEKW